MASIKSIDKHSAKQSCRKRSESIGGDKQTKLLGIDIVKIHELFAQWHHDHKIYDVGKL